MDNENGRRSGNVPRCRAYPRPQMQRSQWTCLNGDWDFALDHEARLGRPEEVTFDKRILVPFSPETATSGIKDTGFYRACWYRRSFTAPDMKPTDRLLLHFGAVDYAATVWINGTIAGQHEGGYTPIHIDVTEFLKPDGPQEIVVRAEDDPHDLSKPRGKQDWQLQPHSIWYPRTTGIWQTVWIERVPESYIDAIRWTPNVERWEIGVEGRVEGLRRTDLHMHVKLQVGDTILSDDVYAVVSGEVHRRIAFSDPGIDDYRNELLWSPSSPILIQAKISLMDGAGAILDEVQSYCGLRSIGVQGDRFVLNGRPYPLRMVLDQGYWPASGLTAPEDEALRHDVELAKAMGFNGVRKHQKIEDPRFLFWADTLGLLVWEEMPSAYRFTRHSVNRLTREWTEAIARDISHPCIIAWVPFNESWGVPDLPDSPAQRHYVQAIYHLTKTLDPTRPVIGNDGWESVATDIIAIHDYDDEPERIVNRYGKDESAAKLFKRERPGGRLLLLSDERQGVGQPIMLTEFGGIAYSNDPDRTWGYTRCTSPEELAEQYINLLTVVRAAAVLSGFCYTQFADTYQEANGLLYADRTPKFPLADIAMATRGPKSARDQQVERAWRDQIMHFQRFQYTVPPEDYQIQKDR